jgi:uncharacterized protein YecT (DUF1311 family)
MKSLLAGAALLLLSLLSREPVAAAEPKAVSAARAAYARADQELNKVYGGMRGGLSKEAMDGLRDEQRKWIEYRDYLAERQAALAGGSAGGDARDTADFWVIRRGITETRVRHLRALLGKGVPPGISGSYGDSYGGIVELLVDGENLLFHIEVVRGPSSHVGNIAGVAKLQGQVAEFSDGGKGHDDGQATTLRFQFTGTGLDVGGQNTDLYHGARASFDGRYVKYRALTPDEAAKLRKAVVEGPAEP